MKNPTAPYLSALNAMKGFLQKAEQFAQERNIDESVLINARLAPDMFDLKSNVIGSSDLAKNMVVRLAGVETPNLEDEITSFDELYKRIDVVIAFIKSVPDANYEGAESREIVMKFGADEVNFTGESYLNMFSIPNFYFHVTTAYNILRHNGVAIGKRDFLGAA